MDYFQDTGHIYTHIRAGLLFIFASLLSSLIYVVDAKVTHFSYMAGLL